MKEISELDIYKLAERLSDLIWYAFDDGSNKVKKTIGYQIIRSSDVLQPTLQRVMGDIRHLNGKGFTTIQEDLSKKQRLGCVN